MLGGYEPVTWGEAMVQANGILVRDMRPGDEETVVEVLTDAFLDFPPVQIVVGTDSSARDRLLRLTRLTVTGPKSSRFLVAERDGDVLGVLQCADQPDCFKMGGRQMLSMVRILGPRLVAAMRMFREVGKIRSEDTPSSPFAGRGPSSSTTPGRRSGADGCLL